MKEICLSYNPFNGETKIEKEGKAVPQNTELCEHIKNAHIQEWEDFFEDLKRYCYDTKIKINFTGLKSHYDYLQDKCDEFLGRHNGECEIVIDHTESYSMIERVQKLNEIIGDIFQNKEIDYDGMLRIVAMADAVAVEATDDKAQFRICEFVAVVGDYDRVDKEGISDGNYVKYNVWEDLEKKFGFSREIISETKDPIICVLEENESQQEMLKIIAEEYNAKGKKNRNKKRFVFVSEEPDEAAELLRDEYYIQNPTVLGVDDISAIKDRVGEYVEEYCLADSIAKKSQMIKDELSKLKSKREQSIGVDTEEIAGFEKEWLCWIDSNIFYNWGGQNEDIDMAIKKAFRSIADELKKEMQDKERIWIVQIEEFLSEKMQKLFGEYLKKYLEDMRDKNLRGSNISSLGNIDILRESTKKNVLEICKDLSELSKLDVSELKLGLMSKPKKEYNECNYLYINTSSRISPLAVQV